MTSTRGFGYKRNNIQREQDLTVTAEMYLKGIPLTKISQWIAENRPYTITTQQLSKDIQKLHRRWIERQMIDFNAAKAKELERINILEQTYWDAWEESKKPLVIEEMEQVNDTTTSSKAEVAPTYSRTKKKGKREERLGDVRCLEGIQWCINKRCQIFGFDAPQKLNVNWREQAEKEGFSPGDVFNNMVAAVMDKMDENEKTE
jgi:hypothetical protein